MTKWALKKYLEEYMEYCDNPTSESLTKSDSTLLVDMSLSSKLPIGKYAGKKLKTVINRNCKNVQSMIDSGYIQLDVEAMIYLNKQLGNVE